MKITTRLMIKEVIHRGWGVEVLDEDFSSAFKVVSPTGEMRYMFSCLSNLSSASGFAIAADKLATYKIAESLDIPVATYMMYSAQQSEKAEEFLRKLQTDGAYMAVKPTDQDHGDGITLNIDTVEKLHEALQYASQASEHILLQRQGNGVDCRLTVVDGEVVAAAYRVPAFVIGDGVHSTRELIDLKNDDPKRSEGHSSPMTRINKDNALRFIGPRKMQAIPHKGEHVQLLGTANLSKGGESIDVTDDIHVSYKDAAVRLAKAAELGVCGVDFLCQDFRQPMAADNTMLLEINCSPGFRMHHFPSQGTPQNVAKAVVDAFAKHNNWQ